MRIEIGNKKIFSQCVFEILNIKINTESFNGISFDSRKIKTGDVFIALKGKATDGHNYIDECVKKGAVLIINESFNDKNIVKVKSSKITLKSLSKLYRSYMNCKVVGITGSNGKTTTKELLAHILKSKFSISYTKENYNSTIGMPMSTFSISSTDEIFIAEIGTNNKGEIKYLSDIAKPDLGVITNISESHLINFQNMSGVYREKVELLKSLTKNGIAFLNMDDPFIASTNLYNRCKVIKYGFSDNLDYSAKYQISSSDVITINDEIINIPDLTKILPQNILTVFSISSELGIDTNSFNERLSSFQVPIGRGNIINHNNCMIINDSYNANYSSMRSGLDMISKIKGANRILIVLGDMLELGEDEQKLHKKLLEHILKSRASHVFTYGTLMHSLYLEGKEKASQLDIRHYKNHSSLIIDLKKVMDTNDIIYVKGSRSMKMEKIIEGIA